MIASLPMYDRPETRAANTRLWHRIRSYLARDNIATPTDLSFGGDLHKHWSDPNLVLSQTCSLPWRAKFQDRLSIVASPVHALDVPPGFYRSVIVMRRGETPDNGQHLAINDPLSQSGWAAFVAHLPDFQPGRVSVTGSHAASARAVAAGDADLAAIDAVTWDMLTEWDRWTERLAVVAETEPTPALPFVSARGADVESLHLALEAAIQDASDADRRRLRLKSVASIPEATYAALPIPPVPVTTPLHSASSRS